VTPRQENNLELLVGQLQGQLSAMNSVITEMKADIKEDFTLVRKDLRNADAWRHEVKERLEKMERNDVSSAFLALQKSIHDGKTTLRGIIIGVGLMGGAVGATLATFFQSIISFIKGIIGGL
jgi:hypothetical protein